MAINHPKAGPNSVPAYQLSGAPCVTASAGAEVTTTPMEVTFPYVTRFFVVQNTSANPMRIGFTASGVEGTVNANYMILSGNDMTPRMEIRCKSLFFRNNGSGNLVARIVPVMLLHKYIFIWHGLCYCKNDAKKTVVISVVANENDKHYQ